MFAHTTKTISTFFSIKYVILTYIKVHKASQIYFAIHNRINREKIEVCKLLKLSYLEISF